MATDHITAEKPSGWQDDPLEGSWWLTLLLRVWLFFDPRWRK